LPYSVQKGTTITENIQKKGKKIHKNCKNHEKKSQNGSKWISPIAFFSTKSDQSFPKTQNRKKCAEICKKIMLKG
jgi:hypothetical protein